MSPQPLDIAPQFAFDLPQYSPDPLLSALGLAMFVVFLVIVTYGARHRRPCSQQAAEPLQS